MTDNETIELNCIRCGKSHMYLLRISRSPFLFGASGNTKRFTRLFTCPEDKEDFQSVLEMKEDNRGTITGLVIIGPTQDTPGNSMKGRMHYRLSTKSLIEQKKRSGICSTAYRLSARRQAPKMNGGIGRRQS